MDKDIRKRILETKRDIFPLDRLLPIETVYSIFIEEYSKTNDRNLFFRKRKFQKLREGYFSMFVLISLDDTSKHKHLLLFPSKPNNDVYICYPKEKRLMGFEFDIKEFTNWSGLFSDFVKEKVIPKINIYNLIIATYRKINGNDLKFLVDTLEQKNINSQVWIVSSPTEENDNNKISKVTIVDRKGFVYDKIIDLNKWIDKNKQQIIYQDIINIKYN